MEKRLLVGITGASGAPYAVAFLRLLRELSQPAEVIVTDPGLSVLEHETGLTLADLEELCARVFREGELSAPPASGSAPYRGMVVLPCSMGTLSAVARGSARNLLQRAADVMLKERRPLVLVVRETPFNLIHLRNMLAAAEAGAVIYPAMPAFYHRPRTLEDMVDFFARRLAEFLGFPVENPRRWKGL
ncbi:UbiX family flavin prenyltransferase [Thermosulfurimonas marina]|uniref:Flavin prenyltransferase UbiX n=1 Tax=Thermosulfurimonas marina TaxID=2047767 RepID=A0A6H1WS24_9BACT|nr:UbiX family flavin prenyltransferase [Thermosulfurimonas marina]QJA05981.1 UbiX family flavin prenyltransferase [Thermosulfurimonas marina]